MGSGSAAGAGVTASGTVPTSVNSAGAAAGGMSPASVPLRASAIDTTLAAAVACARSSKLNAFLRDLPLAGLSFAAAPPIASAALRGRFCLAPLVPGLGDFNVIFARDAA